LTITLAEEEDAKADNELTVVSDVSGHSHPTSLTAAAAAAAAAGVMELMMKGRLASGRWIRHGSLYYIGIHGLGMDGSTDGQTDGRTSWNDEVKGEGHHTPLLARYGVHRLTSRVVTCITII